MANLYGVATPNPLPVGAGTIGAVDIVVSAGVETNVIAITVNNPTVNGFYYPNFVGWITLSFGATAPNALLIGWRLANGADIANLGLNLGMFVANATIVYPLNMQGTALIVSNPTGTNTFNVSINSGAQSTTVRTTGSYCQCAWVRAPDQ